MGRSSSKPLQKPNSPLQEMQYKESQRERTRLQQEKEKKQIVRLQKKQAKKQHGKTKHKRCSSLRSQKKDLRAASSQRDVPYNLQVQTNLDQNSRRYDFRRGDLNRQLEGKIQQQLNEDLCGFILNQMVLTVQFFKNYESELAATAEDMLNSEKLFNHNLEEHSILLTNPLDMAVSKWISYKPLHGPNKHKGQLLQTQTMYVVFENIDIARPNDANYDSISPLCKVNIELDFRETTPCKEDYLQLLNCIKWKGYVRLKLREDPKQSQAVAMSLEDIYSEGSSGYGTTSPYSSKTALNITDNKTEQDYDYAFISHLNTQHPLKELKITDNRELSSIESKVLPATCISALGNFVRTLHEEEFSDDEEESETDFEDSDSDSDRGESDCRDYDTLQAIKLYRIELERRRKLLAQNYLNSREFMKYFGELVRQQLAPRLNITEEQLNDATYRGTSIYTSKYELIPAIYAAQNVSDWPKCAFEFRLRDRPISTNPQTGQQIQWPTRAMIKRIETFGFHVIPLGHAPKKKRNPFREIEWRIMFPKAERYLEQHLTSAQVKVYIISKALIKSFVEPLEKNKALMFALDHLRMHLFWECERDYSAWPEEFLGEVLLRFLNSFKQRVKEKHLSDYFIRERNLFESIPEYSLNSLHTILADITANPLMHLMIALRNLDFSRLDFFPKINFKKLYENLMENEVVKLKMLAKSARCLMDLVQKNEVEACLMADEEAKGLVGLKQHHVRTNGKLRRKTHLLRHNIEMKKQEMQTKRRSVESIDVEFFFQRNIKSSNSAHINQGVENLRRTNVLEIVLDHLLEMAAKAIQFKAVVMAKTYLSQARKLCKCYHNYGCDIGAKEYLACIHNLDEELQIIYDKEDFSMVPPSLPRRISMEPVLPAVPQCLVANNLNVYEEMRPQESFSNDRRNSIEEINEILSTVQSPEPRKSIKFRNVIVEVQTGDIRPLLTEDEMEIKTCLKSPSSKTMSPKSPESSKSIKFRDKVITLQEGNLNSIQKPQGYSPISILRFPHESGQNQDIYSGNEEPEKESNQFCCNSAAADKSNLIPSCLTNTFKSSKDFINSSPIGNSELFQNITQNTNLFVSHITAEERKSQIREMLKRKTLQLKGVFNQSSET